MRAKTVNPLLLDRTIQVRTWGSGQSRFVLESRMRDHEHHMVVTLTVEKDSGVIEVAEVAFLRVPYGTLCQGATEHIAAVEGLTIRSGFSKRVHRLVGGPEGCSHLAHLVVEAARGFLPTVGKELMAAVGDACRKRGLTVEEARKQGFEAVTELALKRIPNSCIAYSAKSAKDHRD